jgi:hypothetical protein
MSTPDQYRAKAAQFTEMAKAGSAPEEVREFQKLERSFTALADNEQWLADNHDKAVHAPAHLGVSEEAEGGNAPVRPRVDDEAEELHALERPRVSEEAEGEHILRCLGAAAHHAVEHVAEPSCKGNSSIMPELWANSWIPPR